MKKRIIASLIIIFCSVLSALLWIGLIRFIMLIHYEATVSCDAGYYVYLERKNVMIPWVAAITAVRLIISEEFVFISMKSDIKNNWKKNPEAAYKCIE